MAAQHEEVNNYELTSRQFRAKPLPHCVIPSFPKVTILFSNECLGCFIGTLARPQEHSGRVR
eukprot:2192949-Amphidinium_carterae.1